MSHLFHLMSHRFDCVQMVHTQQVTTTRPASQASSSSSHCSCLISVLTLMIIEYTYIYIYIYIYQRLRPDHRHFQDSYDFFQVTLRTQSSTLVWLGKCLPPIARLVGRAQTSSQCISIGRKSGWLNAYLLLLDAYITRSIVSSLFSSSTALPANVWSSSSIRHAIPWHVAWLIHYEICHLPFDN